MKLKKGEEELFLESLGIAGTSYQLRAAGCVETFLRAFPPSPKMHSLPLKDPSAQPVSVTLNAEPPTLHVRELPTGGVNAGILRFRQKLIGPDLLPDAPKLALVKAEDITLEHMILTLFHEKLAQIIAQGLIAPEYAQSLFAAQQRTNLGLLIVLKRTIMGIEKEYELRVPYHLVSANDEATFQHLENLPSQLC